MMPLTLLANSVPVISWSAQYLRSPEQYLGEAAGEVLGLLPGGVARSIDVTGHGTGRQAAAALPRECVRGRPKTIGRFFLSKKLAGEFESLI